MVWPWGVGWTFIGALASEKFALMGSFCPKNIMFQLEHSIGIMTLKGHDSER